MFKMPLAPLAGPKLAKQPTGHSPKASSDVALFAVHVPEVTGKRCSRNRQNRGLRAARKRGCALGLADPACARPA